MSQDQNFQVKLVYPQTIAKSSIEFDDKTETIININQDQILNGAKPRLIDEWQIYPPIWDIIRREIDKTPIDKKTGLFILTGSSTPLLQGKVFHSGAGRIGRMNIQTLTFAEIFDLPNDQSISLSKLFENNQLPQISNMINFETVVNYLYIGGWPQIIATNDDNPSVIIEQYIDSILNMDLKSLYSMRPNPRLFRRIMAAIARRTCTQISINNIAQELKDFANRETITKFIHILYDCHILFDIPCWCNTNIRTSNKITTTPKTYFCDTSLVSHVLDVKSPNDFYKDLNTLGLIFENQVMKDLYVYTQAIDAHLSFYRDNKGKEIDAIIELKDGRWAAIEIKLDFKKADIGSKNLQNVIDTLKIEGKYSEPSFKAIITNAECTGITADGTFVIPHTLLKP